MILVSQTSHKLADWGLSGCWQGSLLATDGEKVTCVCVSVEVVRTKKTSWSFSFFFRSEHWLKLPFLTCNREKGSISVQTGSYYSFYSVSWCKWKCFLQKAGHMKSTHECTQLSSALFLNGSRQILQAKKENLKINST